MANKLKSLGLDQLINQLSIISPSKEQGELAVDLHDIYEGVNKLEKLIYEIIEVKSSDMMEDKLIDIEGELDHINWHYRSLKKELKKLLYAE